MARATSKRRGGGSCSQYLQCLSFPHHRTCLHNNLSTCLQFVQLQSNFRLHCRPTVPVQRSSRGPIGSRQPRSGCLSSRTRRQRRHVSNAGSRSRFRFVPATDRHSLLLLPTTATSLSADVPWLPSRPASRRSTLRSTQQRTGTAVPHSQRRQHSRCEAPLRLYQTRRYLT